MSTVPIFSPDGTLGDIPAEQLHAALAAGAKPGVSIKAPDGSIGVVPADRYQEAAKAGGKVIPFEQQETQHPGFWSAVKSYFSPAPDDAKTSFDQWQKKAAGPMYTGPQLPTAQENAQRKAQGYGPTYRALVPAAEAVGMNVKGAEQAASQGDIGGVAGYAAVPAAAAVAPLVAEGAGRLAKPVIENVASKLAKLTPKQAAAVVGGTAGAVAGHGEWSIPGASAGAYYGGRGAEMLLGRERANAPMFGDSGAPVYRDATLQSRNVPEYAGEDFGPVPPQTPENLPPVKEPIDLSKTGGPLKASDFALKRVPLPGDELKAPVTEIVDKAVPTDTSEGKVVNLATKAEVDFHLQRGDVPGAEQAIDKAAKKINSDWPPERPPYAGDTNTIRANLPENVAKRKADMLDDQGIQQQMAQNLEQHGVSAESEARREFIARNSTGVTKGDLIRQAGGTVPDKPVKYTKTVEPKPPAPKIPDDLTKILEESVRQAKLRKMAGAKK